METAKDNRYYNHNNDDDDDDDNSVGFTITCTYACIWAMEIHLINNNSATEH